MLFIRFQEWKMILNDSHSTYFSVILLFIQQKQRNDQNCLSFGHFHSLLNQLFFNNFLIVFHHLIFHLWNDWFHLCRNETKEKELKEMWKWKTLTGVRFGCLTLSIFQVKHRQETNTKWAQKCPINTVISHIQRINGFKCSFKWLSFMSYGKEIPRWEKNVNEREKILKNKRKKIK